MKETTKEKNTQHGPSRGKRKHGKATPTTGESGTPGLKKETRTGRRTAGVKELPGKRKPRETKKAPVKDGEAELKEAPKVKINPSAHSEPHGIPNGNKNRRRPEREQKARIKRKEHPEH